MFFCSPVQYSYILHNIVGAEHEMWNLIDKGFADDEVCRKCKSCGNLTMCDKCFNSYHHICGNMHSKVYKNNELVLCKFCQKYDYKIQWIKQSHRDKMKYSIEIRTNAFYKINRDIISLLEKSVKYTEDKSLHSISEHNSRECNSKKLKLKKFQYKHSQENVSDFVYIVQKQLKGEGERLSNTSNF
ncbi:variant-silencing SET protein, putative [Plasmodium ovale curtisi]|uniref:Variant-silencing SET protein, putative n=1 Tax=Plasmodium ovale curtisi TaxID=864141 RepID=A0A1A8X7V3_PLAOA|nr:variant-silencing SET protein, putative [Plasmodium ovale curtisi]